MPLVKLLILQSLRFSFPTTLGYREGEGKRPCNSFWTKFVPKLKHGKKEGFSSFAGGGKMRSCPFQNLDLLVQKLLLLIYAGMFGRAEMIFCLKHNDGRSSHWQCPPCSFVKINCDASFDYKSGLAGVAAVARDSSGKVIDGANSLIQVESVVTAEALAIRLGCRLAIDRGWNKVIFESDYEEVILRLSKPNCSKNWKTIAIKADVLYLCKRFDEFLFSFVTRNVNKVADWVARQTRQRNCPSNWFACPSNDLLNHL